MKTIRVVQIIANSTTYNSKRARLNESLPFARIIEINVKNKIDDGHNMFELLVVTTCVSFLPEAVQHIILSLT